MKKVLTTSLIAVSIFIATGVFAQGGGTINQGGGGTLNPGGGGTLNTGSQPVTIRIGNPFRNLGDNLYDVIFGILNKVVLPIGGIVVILYIMYAGFLFVTAQGSEDKIKTARKAFTHAAIGAAILLGAVAIAQGIEATIKSLAN